MMDEFEKKWRDAEYNYGLAHHPYHLTNMLRLCHEYQMPPPEWVVIAVEEILLPSAYVRPSRGKRSAEERAAQSTIDHLRWAIVWGLRHDGVSYREVFQAASDFVENDPKFKIMAGSDEAFRTSFRKIQKHEKERLLEQHNRKKGNGNGV